MLFLAVISGLLSQAAHGQNPVNTVAGSGGTDASAGYSGDGGPATNALLNTPRAVAIYLDGSLYIADQGNNVIRKVDGTTGIITTIAGTGVSSTAGDGGRATSAGLSGPYDVALIGLDDFYVADNNGQAIRRVAGGVMTTFAGRLGQAGFGGDGGAATSAFLSNPRGVGVDASGNVYIADSANQRVRKVAAGTRIMSSVAGNGIAGYSGDGGQATAASFNAILGISVSPAGAIYVADNGNQRIRVVSTSGIVTTFAGNGAGQYSGDGGQATSASLYDPRGCDTGSDSTTYIADTGNNVIRAVSPTGLITTFAGIFLAGFTGDGGPATSARFNSPRNVQRHPTQNIVLVPDMLNNRIRSITLPTPTQTPSFTPSETRTPSVTQTKSLSGTPTQTQTRTASVTGTPSLTSTGTRSPTRSPSITGTVTPSPTQSPSVTPTATQTQSGTATRSPTQTQTRSGSPTASQTSSQSQSWSTSYTASQTHSATLSPTHTQTLSQTGTPTATVSPSETQSPSQTQTRTASQTRSVSPSQGQSPSETQSPSSTSTQSATTSRTMSQVGTLSSSATRSPAQTPSQVASPGASASRSATLSGTPSSAPTTSQTSTPSQTQSASGVQTPSASPSGSGAATSTGTGTGSAMGSPSSTATQSPPASVSQRSSGAPSGSYGSSISNSSANASLVTPSRNASATPVGNASSGSTSDSVDNSLQGILTNAFANNKLIVYSSLAAAALVLLCVVVCCCYWCVCREPFQDTREQPLPLLRRDSIFIVPIAPAVAPAPAPPPPTPMMNPGMAFRSAASRSAMRDNDVADALASLPVVQAALARRMTHAAIERDEISRSQAAEASAAVASLFSSQPPPGPDLIALDADMAVPVGDEYSSSEESGAVRGGAAGRRRSGSFARGSTSAAGSWRRRNSNSFSNAGGGAGPGAARRSSQAMDIAGQGDAQAARRGSWQQQQQQQQQGPQQGLWTGQGDAPMTHNEIVAAIAAATATEAALTAASAAPRAPTSVDSEAPIVLLRPTGSFRQQQQAAGGAPVTGRRNSDVTLPSRAAPLAGGVAAGAFQGQSRRSSAPQAFGGGGATHLPGVIEGDEGEEDSPRQQPQRQQQQLTQRFGAPSARAPPAVAAATALQRRGSRRNLSADAGVDDSAGGDDNDSGSAAANNALEAASSAIVAAARCVAASAATIEAGGASFLDTAAGGDEEGGDGGMTRRQSFRQGSAMPSARGSAMPSARGIAMPSGTMSRPPSFRDSFISGAGGGYGASPAPGSFRIPRRASQVPLPSGRNSLGRTPSFRIGEEAAAAASAAAAAVATAAANAVGGLPTRGSFSVPRRASQVPLPGGGGSSGHHDQPMMLGRVPSFRIGEGAAAPSGGMPSSAVGSFRVPRHATQVPASLPQPASFSVPRHATQVSLPQPGSFSVSVSYGAAPPPVYDPFVPPRRASHVDLGAAHYGGASGGGAFPRRSSQGDAPMGAPGPQAAWGSMSGGAMRAAAAGSAAWGGGGQQQQLQFHEKESEGRSADGAGAGQQQQPLQLPQRRWPGGLQRAASLRWHGAALAGAGSGGAPWT